MGTKFTKDCNMYIKAISWSNVYEWIKQLNEGCTELHNKVRLGRLLDLINEETCRILRCLLDIDCHQTISNLHCEISAQHMYVNVNYVNLLNINE